MMAAEASDPAIVGQAGEDFGQTFGKVIDNIIH
jgi:hypothetical protein